MKKSRVWVFLLARSIVAGGATTYGVATSSSPKSTSYFEAALTAQGNGTGTRAYVPTSLSKVLPSVQYILQGIKLRSATLVAVGRFSEPREVPALIDAEQPNAGEVSPAWKRGEVTFTPASVISSGGTRSSVDAGAPLTVDYYFPATVDVSEALDELTTIDQAIVFLAGDTGGQHWSVLENGGLIGRVNQSGQFSILRAERGSDGKTWLGQLLIDMRTLDDVRAFASRPLSILVPDA